MQKAREGRSFFGRGRLRRSWEYKVDGVIWRLVPTASGLLLGEERDLSEKSASFFCLDQVTGRPIWEKATFGEKWWIGIEAVHRDMFFLHGFSTPDLPEHKAIIAADLFRGTKVWSNENLIFIGARDETVYAVLDAPTGRRIIELHYRTGAILKTHDAGEEVSGSPAVQSMSPVSDSVYFPDAVKDLSSVTSPAVMAVQRYCLGKDIVGAVEVLDFDDHLVIFTCHERTGARSAENVALRNTLRVIDKVLGTVLFDDVLTTNAAGVVPESFFVQQHTLYYIADRRRLAAVPLRNPLQTT